MILVIIHLILYANNNFNNLSDIKLRDSVGLITFNTYHVWLGIGSTLPCLCEAVIHVFLCLLEIRQNLSTPSFEGNPNICQRVLPNALLRSSSFFRRQYFGDTLYYTNIAQPQARNGTSILIKSSYVPFLVSSKMTEILAR